MGNVSFLLAADMRRGMGRRPGDRNCRRSFMRGRVVRQRYVQWRNIPVSAHTRLERDHAFHILFCSRVELQS